MTHPLEYHIHVRPLIPASLALFAMLSLPLLLVSRSAAQHDSTSATSSSSGHASSGAATSASSFSHTNSVTTGGTSASRTVHSPSSSAHNNNIGYPRHSTSAGEIYYPYVYGVPIPYAVDATDAVASDQDQERVQEEDQDDDANYQGGPTVFDRRGSGPDSYVPPSYDGPAHSPADDDSPEPPPIPTTLVFKDGHQLEIENYAIVSQTLYDLTPGRPRKIALADLDLSATQKQNDDHGVAFELPSSAQAN
jgi:hypothetical protein